MSAEGSITIANSALPKIRTFARVIGSKAALTVAGRAGANLLRSHFRLMNETRPNKLGGRRTNFYSQIARSVFSSPASATAVKISVAHPAIAQRVYGGEIRAKRSKYLTIPLVKEAYGLSALSYEAKAVASMVRSKKASINARGQTNAERLKQTGRAGVLFPVRLKTGRLVLAEYTATGIRPVFLLVKRVYQAPDNTILPTEAVFTAGVLRELQSFTDSLLE